MNGIAIQPIVKMDGVVLGHEVLIRRRSASGLWELPEDFLPAAWTRDAGRWNVDMYVLDRVVSDRQLHRLFGSLFINVSGSTLAVEDRFRQWMTILRVAVRERGGRIVVEVSEEANLCMDLLVERTEAIRAIGVETAMDDFGSGNHWFPVLREPLWDWVKVWWPTFADSGADLEEVAEYCCAKEIRMIVEGIEQRADIERLETLRPLGLQGMAIAAPQILALSPSDKLEASA